uniref:Uncharacterized protein n=1 Tax=Knipowitschia caucasica TaxID=637954 RepID=A0AAV2K5N6_KNICA
MNKTDPGTRSCLSPAPEPGPGARPRSPAPEPGPGARPRSPAPEPGPGARPRSPAPETDTAGAVVPQKAC